MSKSAESPNSAAENTWSGTLNSALSNQSSPVIQASTGSPGCAMIASASSLPIL